MTHKQVLEAQALRRLQELRFGQDGIGANMGTTELGIVIMVVVMGAFPNTTGTQDQDSKHPHQPFGQPGMRQYCLMLLVVIDHEEPEV
jgi:hypothetical protein